MERYVFEIKFVKEKHCLNCPLRYTEDDSCVGQRDEDDVAIYFDNWEKQLENCPLKNINS